MKSSDLHPIGTEVELLPGIYEVNYRNPLDIKGFVKSYTEHRTEFPPNAYAYEVEWENGHTNQYCHTDLKLLKKVEEVFIYNIF